MGIYIEGQILDAKVDGAMVIKLLDVTNFKQRNRKEFCIKVCAAKSIKSANHYLSADGNYSNVAFFGKTYETANKKYLKWLYEVTKYNDKRDTVSMVQSMLCELKGSY